MKSFECQHLGHRAYQEVWDLQEAHRDAMLEGKAQSTLFFVEHPPTFTMGRGEKGENLKQAESMYREMGFDMVWVNRGGKVTYHGPGQLVAYPVFDLRVYRMGVKDFVCALEKVMIQTLAHFDIQARCREGLIGTWVGENKIGSIGIHVKKSVSIHGLALNVSPIMEHFSLIDPCGIAGVSMVSMHQFQPTCSLQAVQAVMQDSFSRLFL
ncbi:MAG: lipoyl(octanoyl) transferase LipB [Bdellovibrionota bacterium]